MIFSYKCKTITLLRENYYVSTWNYHVKTLNYYAVLWNYHFITWSPPRKCDRSHFSDIIGFLCREESFIVLHAGRRDYANKVPYNKANISGANKLFRGRVFNILCKDICLLQCFPVAHDQEVGHRAAFGFGCGSLGSFLFSFFCCCCSKGRFENVSKNFFFQVLDFNWKFTYVLKYLLF